MKTTAIDAPLRTAATDTQKRTTAIDIYKLSFWYFMGTLILSLLAGIYFFFAYLMAA